MEIFEELSESDIFFLNDEIIEQTVNEVFDEYLNKGYDIDFIQNKLLESIEIFDNILDEAKVTYGHDTSVKKDRLGKVKSVVKSAASDVAKLPGKTSNLVKSVGSRLKSGLKKAISSGARKVASHATRIANRMSDSPSQVHSKPGVRSQNTYRGAGVGTKERVSSSSVTSAPKATPKPKAASKSKTAATPKPKAAASSTRKRSSRKSKLDDLLNDIRNENFILDEKTLSSSEKKKREELVIKMKKNLNDFEKRYPGRGKDVMYATATKMAKKIA